MYELPAQLKSLYRHWNEHAHPNSSKSATNIELNPNLLPQIDAFIAERMRIWHKKSSGQKPPFTNDMILQQYRFCNIYRELDRQTIEIHQLLKPLRDSEKDFPLWLLNIAFCRFVCNPQTICDIGFLSFDRTNNLQVKQRLLDHPRPKYGVAYIFPISTIQEGGKGKYPTRESFFCEYLPIVIPKIAKIISVQKKASVVELLDLILPIFGYNLSFHWTEILIDVAYQFPEYVDLYKEFPIGPGSAPTMHRLNPTADPQKVALELTRHTPTGFPYLTYNGKPIQLSAENWEGIGCEFRKYTNLKSGSGRRRKYAAK